MGYQRRVHGGPSSSGGRTPTHQDVATTSFACQEQLKGHLVFHSSRRPCSEREKLREKLVGVGQRFVGFERELEEETTKRKNTEMLRLAGVQDGFLKLETALNTEIRRRVDANKQVQNFTEQLADGMLDRLQTTLTLRMEKLAASIDSLSARTTALEKGITQFRGVLPSKLCVDAASLVKEILELKTTMEKDKPCRIESENRLLRYIAGMEETTAEKFQSGLTALQNDCEAWSAKFEGFARALDANGTGVDTSHSRILDEVAVLKQTLMAEAQAREQTDDEIVEAMNNYTNALQKSLHAANRR